MTDVLVLWDIDNTLLYTGGAGSLAMARAFRDLYGIEDAFRRVEFSGRTDAAIFRDAAASHGVLDGALADDMSRFIDAYVPHLRECLGEAAGGRLMPGVLSLLDVLATREDVVLGLGTGNFRAGAELKIGHYGLARYFPDIAGGFGEDSESRELVIAKAISRLTDGASPRRVVVIGDTPHDVTAAKANGAVALGVATGRNPVEELRACGADEAVDDLTDIDRVLSFICGY